jgi:predicted nucleic acid-binding protein
VIVVSDTTPINYLVLIKSIDVLPKLFDEVYTAREVIVELADPQAPAAVRRWAKSPPSWLKILTPTSRLPSTTRLDPGEADAISLAKQIGAQAVLMDENKGRKVAMDEGLIVVRTLTLLELAAEGNLISLEPILDRLRKTTFRIDATLLDEAIARDQARKSTERSSQKRSRPK